MKNPYFLTEPSGISFSGGRTSGYMLYRILEAHGGILPDYVKVVFANTGKEMPQTLDFVRDCGEKWGVPVTWVELGKFYTVGNYKKGPHKGKPIYKAKTNIVTYETASRNGEPFDILIKSRRYLPNVFARFCTTELKIRRIKDYLKSCGYSDWLQCLGIRADEQRRVSKMFNKKDENHVVHLPLYHDRVTKETVSDFWKAQDFDLNLPNNNGQTDWGNCDLCFMKCAKKKISIIRQRPDLADWWIEKENYIQGIKSLDSSAAGLFRTDHPDYKGLKKKALENNELNFGIDDTIPCYCGD